MPPSSSSPSPSVQNFANARTLALLLCLCAFLFLSLALTLMGAAVHSGSDKNNGDGGAGVTVFSRSEPVVQPPIPPSARAPTTAGSAAAVATDASVCSSLGLAVLRGEHATWVPPVDPSATSGDYFPQFDAATGEPLSARMPPPTTPASARGNAADAAVATALCIGVANPYSSGVGGGAVLMHYARAAQQFSCFDGREMAPSGARWDMYNGTGDETSEVGVRAIAVPGEVRMLELMHRAHGRLTWSEVVLPVARMCEGGHAVSEHFIETVNHLLPFVDNPTQYHPTFKANWLEPVLAQVQRASLAPRDVLRFPALGRTLRSIAASGADALYTGSVGDDLLADLVQIAAADNLTLPMSRADLAGYTAKVRPVIETTFRTLRVAGATGPFSGGPIMMHVLQVLENLDLSGFFDPADPQKSFSMNLPTGNAAADRARAGAVHWVVEALKLAFSHRMGLGDPDYVPKALDVISKMTNTTRSAILASRLRAMEAFPTMQDYADITGVPLGLPPHESGTSHFSVVDEDGNCVAMTTTINLSFGSTVVSPRTGIVLNDEMDDFSRPDRPNAFGFPPTANNFIAPGKRPLSSMSPTIVVDPAAGRVRFAGGASGGSRIPTATLFGLLNSVVRGRTLADAVGEARVHHQLFPFSLRHETGLDATLLQLLGPGVPPSRANNTLDANPRGIAVCQAIAREGSEWVAASDWRKGGLSRAW